MKYLSTSSYLLMICLVNCSFAYLPTYSVWGSTFSMGDIIVGVIYILRDFAQREIGGKVFYVMVVGCILSYALADRQIAVASICSFMVGETIDWFFYTYTKKPLSQRLLSSSMLSIPVDTVIFLYLINQLTIASFFVMTLAKAIGILFIWQLWHRRQRLNYA